MKCLIFTLLLLSSCDSLKKYPQDNVIEEISEEVIKSKTGLDIDLSPFSPENPKITPR